MSSPLRLLRDFCGLIRAPFFPEQIHVNLFHFPNLVPCRKAPADYLFSALDLCRQLCLILQCGVDELSKFPIVAGGIEQKDLIGKLFTNSIDSHSRSRNAMLKRFE